MIALLFIAMTFNGYATKRKLLHLYFFTVTSMYDKIAVNVQQEYSQYQTFSIFI